MMLKPAREVNPLVLNFRANALCQLNRYNEALSTYVYMYIYIYIYIYIHIFVVAVVAVVVVVVVVILSWQSNLMKSF